MNGWSSRFKWTIYGDDFEFDIGNIVGYCSMSKEKMEEVEKVQSVRLDCLYESEFGDWVMM